MRTSSHTHSLWMTSSIARGLPLRTATYTAAVRCAASSGGTQGDFVLLSSMRLNGGPPSVDLVYAAIDLGLPLDERHRASRSAIDDLGTAHGPRGLNRMHENLNYGKTIDAIKIGYMPPFSIQSLGSVSCFIIVWHPQTNQ